MWVEGGVGGVGVCGGGSGRCGCVWRGEGGGEGGCKFEKSMSGACKMVFTAADFAAPNMTLVPHRGMYEHSCPRMREIM